MQMTNLKGIPHKISYLLSDLVDEMIMAANPICLDDDLPDLLDGPERDKAIDKLIEILEENRGEL